MLTVQIDGSGRFFPSPAALLAHLESLPTVHSLTTHTTLPDTPEVPLIMHQLAQFPHLDSLCLRLSALHVSSLAPLLGTNAAELTLQRPPWARAPEAEVVAREDAVLAEWLDGITSSTSLCSLRLLVQSGSTRTAAALGSLVQRCETLQHVRLLTMPIIRYTTAEPAIPLSQWSITSLTLDGCIEDSDPSTASALALNRSLRRLRVANDLRLPPAWLATLFHDLCENDTLRVLTVACVRLRSVAAPNSPLPSLVEAVQVMLGPESRTQLREIEMSGRWVGDEMLRVLFRGVKQQRQRLGVFNRLSVSHAIHIGWHEASTGKRLFERVVPDLQDINVRELDLRGIPVMPEALQLLGVVLDNNMAVEVLHLDGSHYYSDTRVGERLLATVPRSMLRSITFDDMIDVWTNRHLQETLHNAVQLPKQGMVKAMGLMVLQVLRGSDNALGRLGSHDMFDLNVLALVFQLVTGRAHRVSYHRKVQ